MTAGLFNKVLQPFFSGQIVLLVIPAIYFRHVFISTKSVLKWMRGNVCQTIIENNGDVQTAIDISNNYPTCYFTIPCRSCWMTTSDNCCHGFIPPQVVFQKYMLCFGIKLQRTMNSCLKTNWQQLFFLCLLCISEVSNSTIAVQSARPFIYIKK